MKARESLQLSRDAVANDTGIGAQRLASYEYGRAPVRCDVALRICSELIINEKWLATGQGPMRPCLDLANEKIVVKIKLGELFSRAYSEILSPIYEEIAKEPLLDIIKNRLLTAPTDRGRILLLFDFIQDLLLLNIYFNEKDADFYIPFLMNVQGKRKDQDKVQEHDNLFEELFFVMAKAGIEFMEKKRGKNLFIELNKLPMAIDNILAIKQFVGKELSFKKEI